MLFFYTLLLTSYAAEAENTGASASTLSSLVTATSTDTLSSGLGYDIHGQVGTGTTTGFQRVGDDANAFTTAWWDEPKVAATLKFNLGKAGVVLSDDASNQFVAAWINIAKTMKGPSIQKQMAFKKLIDDYNLRDYCSVSPKGREVLWSGHVKNSVYSRGLKPARTPLETTKMAEALSETFGTEHYPTALTPKDAFGNVWLPGAADMFNAATLIYSLYMKPKDGILEVYTNQIKEDAVFYKTELPLLAFMKNVKKIRFLIMTPPTPTNGPQQYNTIDVDITDLVGNLNSGKECTKRIMETFMALPKDQVTKMWKNDFNIKVAGRDESHAFIDPSEGTRQKKPNAAAAYSMFFKNFVAPKSETETAIAEDQRQEIVVKTSLPQYITVPTAAMFVAGLMGMVGLLKNLFGMKRTQNLYTPLKGIEEI